MRTKTLFAFIAAALFICVIFACEKRKDFLIEKETNSNTPPTMGVKRMTSGQPFVENFVDTFLVPASGYRLQYQINDNNFDINTFTIVATSNAANVLSTTHYKDSSMVLIKLVSNIGSVSFKLSIKDKFGQEGFAYFKVVSQNQTPNLSVKKYGTLNAFSTSLVDTLKRSYGVVYDLAYNFSDDNAQETDIQIIKKTPGDNSIITTNTNTNKISIDYTMSSFPKSYTYWIFVTDPLGVSSDTSIVTIYTYRNLPPAAPTLVSAAGDGTNGGWYSYVSDSTYLIYNPSCETITWNTANGGYFVLGHCALGLGNIRDADASQGGFITKMKYTVKFKPSNCYGGSCSLSTLIQKSFVKTSGFSTTNFNQTYYYKAQSACIKNPTTSLTRSFEISGYVYDNENDSTYFNFKPVW